MISSLLLILITSFHSNFLLFFNFLLFLIFFLPLFSQKKFLYPSFSITFFVLILSLSHESFIARDLSHFLEGSNEWGRGRRKDEGERRMRERRMREKERWGKEDFFLQERKKRRSSPFLNEDTHQLLAFRTLFSLLFRQHFQLFSFSLSPTLSLSFLLPFSSL